jgi:uncharacterized protein involved in type VI secretion and phage assembly
MRLAGAYYGIVCDNRDPDHLGRVQLRLPWLDNGDAEVARWAQLATPMAGAHVGWYALPERGDVVVVMFVAGDVAQPVVLGGAWSTADAPPDGERTHRGYYSRSGHRLVLDDGAAASVALSARGDRQSLALAAGGVAIDARSGGLAITAAGTLAIHAQQDLRVAATTSLDASAAGDLTVDARSTAKLGATGVASFDAPTTRLG